MWEDDFLQHTETFNQYNFCFVSFFGTDRHCPFLSLIRKCPIPVGSDFACQVLLASVTDPHSESLMSHFRLIVEDPARSEPLVSPSFRLPTSLKFAKFGGLCFFESWQAVSPFYLLKQRQFLFVPLFN